MSVPTCTCYGRGLCLACVLARLDCLGCAEGGRALHAIDCPHRDDHSASRRADVLADEAPHLIAPELLQQWRTRADRLDDYGRALRREGDTRGAEDAEQAATEYRTAADTAEVTS